MSIRRTLSLADITIIDTGGAQSQRLYPIADHLGSPIAIADGAGHLIQGLAYADFGKRYSAGWAAALTTGQAVAVNTGLSDRGYTGQESLDAIGLDDYNARLYDPKLGRFLSVDPLIAHPGSTQSINPYSYVENNPLNKVDPTGECGIASHIQSVCDTGGSWNDYHSGQTGPDANSSGSGSTPGGGKQQGGKAPRQGPTAHNSTGDTSIAEHQVDNKTAARLSSCVYHTSCVGVGHWNRQSNRQLKALGLKPSHFLDNSSGFKAGLFFNSKTYVLAFAGTENRKDWGTDFAQADGLRTTQYDEAVKLSRAVARATNGNLTLTGHSLGAGLAMAGALWAHIHAVVFNPAWLSKGTIDRYGLDKSEAGSLITAYHTEFDPVTAVQEIWDVYHSTSDSDYLVPLGHQVEIPGWHFHSISGVCEGLGTSC